MEMSRYFGALRLTKGVMFACLVTVVLAAPSRAEMKLPIGNLVFNISESEPRNGTEFELTSEVENIVESKIKIYRTQRAGKDVYVMEKEDRTKKNDRLLWTFYLDTEQLGLMQLQKKMLNREGQMASEIWYDYENPMFGFPKNLCYMYTIPIWLMGRDLKVGARYDFNILLSYNSVPMHMFADVKCIVRRTVPAGTFETYLIKLEPDLDSILGKWKWAKSIIGPWVPNYYFWLDVNEPHTMVRFEGKFGPVGAAPTQTYELVSSRPE